MSPRTSRRNVMLLGASALVLCGAMPAIAQAQTAASTPSADTVEEVVVTGQRAALQSAQKLKQNAEQLVDSITATDIGALPDRSVTEALQRVSGVTIGRTAEARDASRLSIEGSGVQVRGLSWVRGELNGRDSYSAKSGRALSFEDVSPELMAGVDVYKNPSADLIEGGIGGTVNMRTRLPFDQNKRLIAYSADMSYGDLRKKWEPSVSGLYSDRWDTPIGEIGLLLNASYSELASRADTISVDPYNVRTDLVPGKTVYVPGGYGYRSLDLDRTRKGWSTALQWRPNDMLEFTGTIIQSSALQAASEHAIGFSGGTGNGPAGTTTFQYDSTGHFLKGAIASAPGAATLGSSFMDARYNERNSVTTDYSFNIKFTPNDKWAFSFDNQYVFAKTKSVDFTAFVSFFDQPAPTLDLTGDVPYITMPTNQQQAADPNNYYLNAAMDHHDANRATEWAQRFDGEYSFDEGSLAEVVPLRHSSHPARLDHPRNHLSVGTRWRRAWTGSTSRRACDPTVNNIPGYQGYYGLYTFDNYFRGDVKLPRQFILPTRLSGGTTAKVAGAHPESRRSTNGGGWPCSTATTTANGRPAAMAASTISRKKRWRPTACCASRTTSELNGAKTRDRRQPRRARRQDQGQGRGSAELQQHRHRQHQHQPAADQAFANGASSEFNGGRTTPTCCPA
jgi:TonB-dependent receptor